MQQPAYLLLLPLLLCLGAANPLAAQIPCNGEFINSGNATNVDDCIQLTANTTGQQGCTWLNTPVDFSEPISHTMNLNFGFLDANGADGICLVYQPGGTGVCGDQGGGIGAQGIPNSFIVEFDTWDNGPGFSDIPNDHCAIDLNGNIMAAFNGPVDLGNIEDGSDHIVTFDWNPATMFYSVSFDGVTVLSGIYDIIGNVFGGNPLVYWGYTASTGGSTNTHLVCPILPPPIIVDAGPDAELPCAGSTLMLNAGGSDQGPGYSYNWSTNNGQILGGANTLTPTIGAPGTYVLTLTTASGCVETDEITVGLNTLDASILPPDFLTCTGELVWLDGSNSSSGPFITYQWSTPDGNIVNNLGAAVEVDAVGTYILTVLYDDGFNQCTAEANVVVQADPDAPVAFAPDAILTCDPATIELDGSASSVGSNYAYEWSTTNGWIVQGEFSLYPTIAAPGEYTLLVTNIFTNCTDEYTVSVTPDQLPPVAFAVAPDSITCAAGQVVIDGSLSSQNPPIYSYQWSAQSGGVILAGQGSLLLTVGAPGAYTLTVLNTINGCTADYTVDIAGNNNAPTAAIAAPDTLTCNQPTTTLLAGASSQGPGFTYQWTTADGVLTGPTDTLVAVAAAAGTYTLTVLNTDNQCATSAAVTVPENVTPPLADAGTPLEFSCDDTSLMLDGSASSQGPGYTYQWTTTNGLISAGNTTLQPTITSAGLYQLVVTNALNGCRDTASVLVTNDTNAPLVTIAPADTLNCLRTSLTLDASGSSAGPEFSVQWTTADGRILSGDQTYQALVDRGGLYTFSITNLGNGCESSASVLVVQDTLRPLAMLAPTDTLTCGRLVADLNGSGSSQGPQFVYQWSPGSQLLGGQGSLLATTNQPGLYQLEVTNTINGCRQLASATVVQDTIAPTAAAAPADTLNCQIASVALNGTASSQGPAFDYAWSTANGSLSGPTNTPMATAAAPGVYTLLVRNTFNDCTQTTSVAVQQDTVPPVAEAGPDQVINCNFATRQLDGLASSSGLRFVYQWTALTGNLTGGANTPQPTVDQAGTYQLRVTDQQNGCTTTDTVTVTADLAPPLALIAPPALLTCIDTSLTLDGSASSSGGQYTYVWTTTNGFIQGDATASQVVVNQAGDYQLLVTNTTNGCTATATTTVNRDANIPTVTIAPALPLTCVRTEVLLEGTVQVQGANFTLAWTTANGQLVGATNGLTSRAAQPGVYSLRVTDLDNNCTASASLTVTLDNQPPTAVAGDGATLTCVRTDATLDGGASSQGSTFGYQWLTNTGNLLAGDTTLAPLVGAPGDYILRVTNRVNGCTQTDTVTVTQDTLSPVLALALPDILNCVRTTLDLDALASSSGPAFQYSWTTADGRILAGANSASPTVDAPGVYTLTIVNDQNGCTSMGSVAVTQDTLAPQLGITPPGILTCATLQLPLAGQANAAGPLQYQWSTTTGQLVGATNLATATAAAPGAYTLRVVDQQNGCSATSAVTVLRDNTPPTVVILPPATLTCVVDQVTLSALGSSVGPRYTYTWVAAGGGVLLNGQNGLQPTVGAAGNYTLTILDTVNQCVASGMVTVQRNDTPPLADAGANFVIPCFDGGADLDGSGSSVGPQYQYQWTTTDGQLTGAANQLNPRIEGPGRYQLVVTNLNNGCVATDEVVVTQLSPRAAPRPIDPLCYGQTGSIAIDSVQGGTPPYVYSANGGNFFQTSPLFTELAAGPYTVVVQDANGCEYRQDLEVRQPDSLVVVITEPEVWLQLGESHQVVTQVNVPEENLADISWEQGGSLSCGDCLNPVATPLETSAYRIRVRDTNGCRDEALLRIIVSRDIRVYIPSGFSPNGDGVNDRFVVYTQREGVAKVRAFEVYNRWGESVFSDFNFQPNDPDHGWDGLFRGQLMQPAVFAYYAEIELVDGEVLLFKGDVTLLR